MTVVARMSLKCEERIIIGEWSTGYGIAAALEAAHVKNIIHRDLKPANILVTKDGVVSCSISDWRNKVSKAPAARTTNSVGLANQMATRHNDREWIVRNS